MALASNYPNGFPNGVTLRNLPIVQTNPGKIFWVSNNTTGLLPGHRGGSDGNRGTWESPFATLQGALNNCVANRGDVIYIKPGHAESIASATALLFNKAGVAIIGLGTGSSRPTFTFTTANTAKIPVSKDNISIQNCVFIANFLSIATCFLLTTAAYFTVDSCEFSDTSAVLDFLSIVTTTVSVNSDFLTFINNRVKSDGTTTPGPTLVIANTMKGLTVNDNYVVHTVATDNIAALIEHGALVMSQAMVARNLVYSINSDTATGAILIKTTATTGSGIVIDNVVRTLDAAAAILVTVAAVQYGMARNLHIDGATFTSGYLLPAVGAD